MCLLVFCFISQLSMQREVPLRDLLESAGSDSIIRLLYYKKMEHRRHYHQSDESYRRESSSTKQNEKAEQCDLEPAIQRMKQQYCGDIRVPMSDSCFQFDNLLCQRVQLLQMTAQKLAKYKMECTLKPLLASLGDEIRYFTLFCL